MNSRKNSAFYWKSSSKFNFKSFEIFAQNNEIIRNFYFIEYITTYSQDSWALLNYGPNSLRKKEIVLWKKEMISKYRSIHQGTNETMVLFSSEIFCRLYAVINSNILVRCNDIWFKWETYSSLMLLTFKMYASSQKRQEYSENSKIYFYI